MRKIYGELEIRDTVILVNVMGCNLHCDYCYMRADIINVDTKDGTLDYELKGILFDNKEIICKLQSLYDKGGINRVDITGGEPSIYENEVYDLVNSIKNEYPEWIITLHTNGTNPIFVDRVTPLLDMICLDYKTTPDKYEKRFSIDTTQYMDRVVKTLTRFHGTSEIILTLAPGYIDSYEDIDEIIMHLESLGIATDDACIKIILQKYNYINAFKKIKRYCYLDIDFNFRKDNNWIHRYKLQKPSMLEIRGFK